MLAGCQQDQHIRQIEFLKAENELLRRRVPKKRIFLNPDERAYLLKLGKELGPAIRQVITIVSYSAVLFLEARAEEFRLQKQTALRRPRRS